MLVQGAGPVGLTALLMARAAGAAEVLISDVRADQLDLAASLSAAAIFDAADPDLAALARDRAGGPLDVAIDCSGAESAVRAAIAATRPGGTVVLVGMGAAEMQLPILDVAAAFATVQNLTSGAIKVIVDVGS